MKKGLPKERKKDCTKWEANKQVDDKMQAQDNTNSSCVHVCGLAFFYRKYPYQLAQPCVLRKQTPKNNCYVLFIVKIIGNYYMSEQEAAVLELYDAKKKKSVWNITSV